MGRFELRKHLQLKGHPGEGWMVRCFRRNRDLRSVDVRATVLTAKSDIFFPGSADSLRRVLPNGSFRALPGIHLWVLLDPGLVEAEIVRALGE